MLDLFAMAFLATSVGSAQDDGYFIRPGSDWVALKTPMDVARGSALDWSPKKPEPCGTRGWLTATREGKFAFEKTPDQTERFYGPNLCFSAMFLEKREADRLVNRLVAMGYNTVRFHHYDGEITGGWEGGDPKDSTKLVAEKMDRLDYLLAQCRKKGLYVAIDLYTIRRIRPNEVLEGDVGMDEFKALLLVSEKARRNWLGFATNLFEHRNPYTGLKWKEDPTVAWVCVVNENNFGSAARSLSPKSKELFDAAYKADGHDGPWQWGTNEGSIWAGKKHVETYAWMRDQLRRLGVKALLTDNNGWYDQRVLIQNRKQLDLVDNHFYWDHPRFLGSDWGLPSQGWQTGRSSIPEIAGGLKTMGLSRLDGKPFTCTELNFTAPNPHRIEGGLLGGAIAARQDWDGVWRFAWSHDAGNIRAPKPIGFFDVQCDPIQQASERAFLAVYLKEHLAPASDSTIVKVDPVEEAQYVYASKVTEQALSRRYATSTEKGGIGDDPVPTRPQPVLIDAKAGTLSLASAQTCGVVGPAGSKIEAGVLEGSLKGAFAALWASSLTGAPLAETKRALIVFATDVQNTDARYRAEDRQILEAWGTTPHLARKGSATVKLTVQDPDKVKVHRLDLSGRRVARVNTEVSGSTLEFEVEISEKSPTFYYELVRD